MRTRIGVQMDGPLEFIHGGTCGRRCGLKGARLSTARLPCVEAITNAGSAPISRATLLYAASMATMESVSVPSWIRAGDSVHEHRCTIELPHYVEDSKSAASTKKAVVIICAPEAPAVHGGFKICHGGCGSTSSFRSPRLSSAVAQCTAGGA